LSMPTSSFKAENRRPTRGVGPTEKDAANAEAIIVPQSGLICLSFLGRND